MPWRCIYRTDSGQAVSFGTDTDSPVPAGHSVAIVSQGERLPDNMHWDPATRAMVPTPPKVLRDKITDIMAAITAAGVSLNATNTTRVRNVLIAHVTEGRFY